MVTDGETIEVQKKITLQVLLLCTTNPTSGYSFGLCSEKSTINHMKYSMVNIRLLPFLFLKEEVLTHIATVMDYFLSCFKKYWYTDEKSLSANSVFIMVRYNSWAKDPRGVGVFVLVAASCAIPRSFTISFVPNPPC